MRLKSKSTKSKSRRSISKAVTTRPWGVALALCAVPTVLYAQAAITPATPQGVPEQPAVQTKQVEKKSSDSMPQREGRITLEFRSASVVQLITMIAQQSDIGIIIGPDVDDSKTIPYISLREETPEGAIKKAAMAARLQWKKVDEKTYMVGNDLPDIGDSSQQVQKAKADIPVLPFSTNNDRPTSNTLPDVLDDITSKGGKVYTALPSLYGDEEEESIDDNQPSYAMIKVHNVRPDIMAYWIDPENHPLPAEYRAAQQGIDMAINQHPLRSGVDPNIWSQLTGNSGATNPYGSYASNPYSNPYGPTTPLGYGANQPYFQGNAQFGGNRSRSSSNRGGLGGGSGALESPKGIGTIISIDAHNTILTYGTPDGIKKLREIIDFLDRPVRQVEIEAQFVDIGTTDANAFGLNISSRGSGNNSSGNNSSNNGRILSNLGTVPSITDGTSMTMKFGHYQATLRALISDKKARIVNSPRVTTLNNLTAYLFSATSTPIVLNSSTSGIGGQVGNQQNAFFLTTSIGIIVTPTINNDDTITVFLTPQVQIQTPIQSTEQVVGGGGNNSSNNNNGSSGASSIPAFTSQYLTTVATVKDGDTIVLGGLRTKNVSYTENRIPILSSIPFIGNLFKTKQKNDDDRELVIFLTARILHRTDDLAPLPGT